MRLKLVIVISYALAFAAGVASSTQSLASSKPIESTQAQRVSVRFDATGRRGLVLFDHKKHEALIDPDPAFPHKSPPGVACIGCHHTVKDVTIAGQFQKCSACHKSEGHPDNPEDREGYDLNSRDTFHRLCIGCHRASNVNASNERFRNVSFTRCSECHDRGAQPGALAEQVDEQPPPEESDPRLATRPRTVTGLFRTPMDPPLGYAGASRIDTARADNARTKFQERTAGASAFPKILDLKRARSTTPIDRTCSRATIPSSDSTIFW